LRQPQAAGPPSSHSATSRRSGARSSRTAQLTSTNCCDDIQPRRAAPSKKTNSSLAHFQRRRVARFRSVSVRTTLCACGAVRRRRLLPPRQLRRARPHLPVVTWEREHGPSANRGGSNNTPAAPASSIEFIIINEKSHAFLSAAVSRPAIQSSTSPWSVAATTEGDGSNE
jgi:hypothetical protein